MEGTVDKKTFDTEAKPNWCVGCGNFGIQNSLKKALATLEIEPHKVVLSTGIGCSSKIAHWVNVYGLHSLHGRALPIAAGIKLANSDLCVIAEGGDGDGFSEGMNHFVQACRRNVDFTYLVHNNGVFSLTTGQTSSTGRRGFKSVSTPEGSIEPPFNPLSIAISAGATFVARGFSGDMSQLSDLIVKGVNHKGFAFIEILQVCVSHNPARSSKWYKERVYKLEDEGHDPHDKIRALQAASGDTEDRIATGVFYVGDRPRYDDSLEYLGGTPLVKHSIGDADIESLMEELV